MSKGSSPTTSTQTSEPWSGVQPYLLGTGSGPGIYSEAQRLYQSGGWTPEMQALVDEQQKNLAGRQDQVNLAYNLARDALKGTFDPKISPVGSIGAGKVTAKTVEPKEIAGADKIVAQMPSLPKEISAQMVEPPQAISGSDKIVSKNVDPALALASLGETNPTGAIKQMLTGRADTYTLDPVVQSALRRLGEGFSEQVLPNIRGEAIASGQYGGSRQGIAEGIASRGLLYSMGDVANNMYNQAYQQAQQNMYGTASNMAGLGINSAHSNATRDLAAQTSNALNQLDAQKFNADLYLNNAQANANRDLTAQTFNANLGFNNSLSNANRDLAAQTSNAFNQLDAQKFNSNLGFNAAQLNANLDLAAQNSNVSNQLSADRANADIGLQNNAQQMQLAQQQLAGRMAGLNMFGIGNSLTDQTFQQGLSLLTTPDQYNWNNLNNYSSIVQNGARLGGTLTASQQNYTNPIPGALGGALAGAQLASMTGLMGSGAGAGIGALLGLLSDRRFKTDIERVGTLDNGLAVYRYRYKSGGPIHLGVMADEVKAVNPDAVITVDGVDYVNYGRL